MSHIFSGAVRPGVELCRYDNCDLVFRGPPLRIDAADMACLGGDDTFARFVTAPYPQMLGRRLGRACVNLGCAGAGVEAWLGQPHLIDQLAGVPQKVVQLTGAHCLTNPYFRVHPRRNDRLVEVHQTLRSLFPEPDFIEFSFNGHLLRSLSGLDAARFDVIRRTLQDVWTERMGQLLDRLGGPVVLLWIRRDGQPDAGLLEPGMIAPLLGRDVHLVETCVTPAGAAGDMDALRHGPMEEPAAAASLGPTAHGQITDALLPYL
ncbi:MAG: DUF6473 family protein [Marinibacterium sp.]|nr:DUF6473 family protein [Marinibacterium sp.]